MSVGVCRKQVVATDGDGSSECGIRVVIEESSVAGSLW